MEFWLLRNNEKYGPYSQEKIIELAKQGNLSGSDRLWHQGLKGWDAPLSVLPSLELFDSGHRAIKAPNPEASPEFQQGQDLSRKRSEQRRRRSTFLRSGLTWIPLFSALLVGSIGLQPFVKSMVGPGLTKEIRETGWLDPEEAELLVNGGASVLVVVLFEQSRPFRIFSWCAGLFIGVVNGLSFGAILGWLAARVGSRGSLRAKIFKLSALGGAIALILNSIFGKMPLALLVGYLSWREGLLLGACFAVVHTLDEFRTRAVSSRKLEGGV